MGCDYGQILFIGVKLLSIDELIDTQRIEVYGCEHKKDGVKFCPECGNKAKRYEYVDNPKISMLEDWKWDHDKPVINDKFYVFHDEYEKVTFVGVYSKLEYVPGDIVSLKTHETVELLQKRAELLAFLEENQIKYEEDSFGIHMIPYISC